MEPTIYSRLPGQPASNGGPQFDAFAQVANVNETVLDTVARLTGSIWWMTTSDGLIAGQRALSAYTGLPEAALAGEGWIIAIAPADRPSVSQQWRAAASTLPVEMAARVIRQSGQYEWLSLRARAVPASAGEPPRQLWVATQTAQERAVRSIGSYRALFDQTAQGFMLIGAQGVPLRANATALQLLGLSFEQARGAAPLPAGWQMRREDGSTMDAPFRVLADMTTQGQAIQEFWQVTADEWDSGRWLNVTCSPVLGSSSMTKQRTLVYLTDVTGYARRRQAMQSLAETTTDELTALRAALDRITDAFIVLDYEGHFTYLNARAREQFAPTGERLLGRRFWEVFPTLAGSAMEGEYRRILREQTPGVLETTITGETWFELRSYPAPDGISVYIRDITSQKRTMAELDAALARERAARAEAEERAQQLDAVFEGVGDGMLVFGRDGSVLRANQAMRDLMALLGEDLTLPMPTSPFEALLARVEADATAGSAPVDLPLRRILAGETVTGDRTVDLPLRTPEGRNLYLNISGAPIRGSDGSIVGAVENFRDVTAKREAELERNRTLSLVAHELRTPLTAIKLSIDLSLRRAKRGLDIEAATLDVAASSCLQLEHMVSDLVDAARAEREKMAMTFAMCDAGALMTEAVTEQQATTDKPINYTPPQTPLPLLADSTRIRQVLSNLISNAVKYSPPGAPVTLRAEQRDGSVWFGVSDEGPGVSAVAIPHLFEAFYRAPDVVSPSGPNVGLGLGLFLCKRIVDMHGGQIGMENRPEGGSLFWFTLPLAQPVSGG